MHPHPALVLEDVACRHDGRVVVSGVSLTLDAGEIGCLLGPSGCGKTTTLRAIAGFEPVTAGRILIHGVEVSTPDGRTPTERRRLGMVFQDHALYPHLDVAANVAFGLHGLPRAQRARRVAECLALVRLAGLERRMPHELSGGQRQRVALARALAPAPQLLLLDEPFASLDLDLRRQLNRELAAILRRAGTTTLMVTHDHEQAFSIADRVGVLSGGRLRQWAAPEQLHAAPADREVATFLGLGVVIEAEVLAADRVRTVLGEATTARPVSGATVPVLLRPEHLPVTATDDSGGNGVVAHLLVQGGGLLCEILLDAGPRLAALVDRAEALRPGARVQVGAPRRPLTPVAG